MSYIFRFFHKLRNSQPLTILKKIVLSPSELYRLFGIFLHLLILEWYTVYETK